MDPGLVCHVCGTLNALSAPACSHCGAALSQAGGPPAAAADDSNAPASPTGMGAPQPSAPAPAGQGPSVSATVVAGAGGAPLRFDPATGQPLSSGGPAEAAPARTLFFGALQQQPVVPRLVVIKGEGGDGATYHLQQTSTSIGRSNGDITFAEDPFLSPEHAKFTAQDGRLFVQDAGSANGVFLRIKKPTPVADGTYLLVGEQLLRLRRQPFTDGSPNENGTYYYGSPRPEARFQVIQCLAGGGEGRVTSAEDGSLSLGREGNTMNFPDDRFISGHHARLESAADSDDVVLTDTGSRNGTFIRLQGAQELFHGDYLFLGQQLLRVEIA
ncbi:MAG: FHA domain-containing protein [Myxococcota bacterium]